MAWSKEDKVITAIIVGAVTVYWLSSRSSPVQAAPQPLPPPPPPPRHRPDDGTQSRQTVIEMPIVPLQDPRIALTNTGDPAKDRLVTNVLSAQLDALHAPQQPTVILRATAYLHGKGSPTPSFTTQADVLYWAAQKIDREVQAMFYRTR
jgi:hypothetical protein